VKRPRIIASALRFARDRSGTIAVLFALSAPVLLAIAAVAVQFAIAMHRESTMQAAADAAALAGAKELGLADATRSNVDAVVRSVVQSFVAANSGGDFTPIIDTKVTGDPQQVEVHIRATMTSFLHGFGISIPELNARAVARVAGRPNICALALERSEAGAFWLESNARMTGNECAAFSNSRASSGMVVRDSARLTASAVCTAGGLSGSGMIDPEPYLDCPQFDDPLANRPEPPSGGCDHMAKVVLNQTTTLQPGVYCLGLTIAGLSRVTFEPGVYVIKDGPFLVTLSSSIEGDGDGFFLKGAAFFTFDPLTTIKLSAPKTGPMAGLLFFGSRTQSTLLQNIILSNNAQTLIGTIYLPRNSFVADALAQIGGDSSYTAIVARRILLLDGPHLVLNSDYDGTDIPVPDGIRGSGQPVTLVK
jgi:hypothetical protein